MNSNKIKNRFLWLLISSWLMLVSYHSTSLAFRPPKFSQPGFSLETKMANILPGTDVLVITDQCGITLKIPVDNLFNQCGNIDPWYYTILNKVVGVLNSKDFCGHKIRVRGYSDDIGSVRLQVMRSAKYARKLANYLSSAGVHPARIIEISGQGNRWPMADSSSIVGKAYNRRIEVTIAR